MTASNQPVFLPARYFIRYFISGESSNLSEQLVAMPFLLLPLNGAIRYRNTMHSKPLPAHDNSSGLGRNRTVFNRLSSAVTCCSAPPEPRTRTVLTNKGNVKIKHGARNTKWKMQTILLQLSGWLMMRTRVYLMGHFDHLLHKLSHPAKGWTHPVMSGGSYTRCAELRMLNITQKGVPRNNLILTKYSCRLIALQSFACNKVINRS